jgi:diguanylate cyclase (GGDEF)-like protein
VALDGRLPGPRIAAPRTLEDALGQIAALSEQALQDETTGLPNRRALLRWLAEVGDDTPLAVLLVDFDGLRAVNNVLGHHAGDELIRRVAAGIQESIRPTDLVARLHGSGGDEFVVCCPGLGEEEAADRASELEQHLLELRMPRAIRHLYRGASVGSAVRSPREDPVLFIERATVVLHRRKALRRGEQT